ncbi:MAG: M50 family metallopeptidase [Candidatus Krumholzibacteriota bacterium]|nr:M50 family metallopeptidase [Candidatus Krumholzibacteriota bacterium]
MRSLSVGRILGIEVRLHVTFPLFILLLGVLEASSAGWQAGLRWMAILATLFGFVFLHELGHSLMARRFGFTVRAITLLPIGGLATMDALPRRPSQEILIALAGPAVNLVLAALLVLALLALRLPLVLDVEGTGGVLSYLFLANLVLALFNLVPAFPLDGGRVLRALLALRLPYLSATRRAVLVGQAFAVAFLILGIWRRELWMLAAIALFLFWSGRREERGVTVLEAFRERRVGDFLDPRPWFRADRDTRFVELKMALLQEPNLAGCVVDLEGLRYGLLTRRDLNTALLAMPPDLQVHRLVESPVAALPADLPIGAALGPLRGAPRGLLPVRRGRELVGVLSVESLPFRIAEP